MFLPQPAACGPAPDLPCPERPKTRRIGLDPAERSVVLLARADAARFGWDASLPRSLLSASLRHCFSGLTGIEAVPALADARLERLRLFACMMRRGDARAYAMAERLMIDGFSEHALREAVGLALG